MKKTDQKAFPYLVKGEIGQFQEELKAKYKEHATPITASDIVQQCIQKHLNPQKRILDVGSANGLLLELLHKKGYKHTYAADIADFLTVARPREEFKAVDLNFEHIPWPDRYFQAVTAIETYEHLENPFHFIREIARVLEDGGYLLLTTPNPNHLFNRLSFLINGDFYRFSEKNDHIALLTKPVFRKCILRHFELMETRYWKGEFPYRWFSRFRYPASPLFGRSVIFVLKKKSGIT